LEISPGHDSYFARDPALIKFADGKVSEIVSKMTIQRAFRFNWNRNRRSSGKEAWMVSCGRSGDPDNLRHLIPKR
jgi:hypothetical protein